VSEERGAAVPPFEWSCRRSGRCCTHGEGRVWLLPGEEESLARALGLSLERFLADHVVQVGDGRSLKTPGGRCSLLAGSNECTAYAARPAQCASFPYWPAILEGGAAYERALAICPGLRPRVPEEVRARAFAALRLLYAEVEREIAARNPRCDLRGVCCDFEKTDHVLYATRLETDYAVAQAQALGPALAPAAAEAPSARKLCPFWKAGRCTHREGRPLGCRIYFCDPGYDGPPLYERFHAALQALCAASGYPYAYGRFVNELPEADALAPAVSAEEPR
jgi:Fe-S-cluster containining protein